MSVKSSGRICRHFLQNACNRGDDCRFLHQVSSPDPTVVSSPRSGSMTPSCPHFIRGECRYGDRCRMSHSTTGDASDTTGVENVAVVENPANDPWGATGNHSDPWAANDPWTSTPTDSNGWPTNSGSSTKRPKATQAHKQQKTYKTKPCQYYAQGKCFRGDSCYYLHSASSGNRSPKSPRDQSSFNRKQDFFTDNSGLASATPVVGPPQVCHFFIRGQCPRGESCPFVHGSTESRTGSGENMRDGMVSSSPCQLFLKGKCTRRAACPFLHEKAADEATTSEAPSIACQLYPAGKCTRGFTCPFLHDAADAAHLASSLVTSLACQFFVQGSCSRGDNCPFPHVVMPPSKSINPEASSPQDHAHRSDDQLGLAEESQDQSGRCKYFDRGHCLRGSTCRYLHDGDHDATAPVGDAGISFLCGPCKFFPLGDCKNGDNCMFTHNIVKEETVQEQPFNTWGDEEEQPVNSWGNEQSASLEETSVQKDDIEKKNIELPYRRVCRLFSQGHCKFGDSCRYQHDTANVQQGINDTTVNWSSQTPKNNVRKCTFFAGGNCKKGSACMFLHESNGKLENDNGWGGTWDLPMEPNGSQEVLGDICNSWGYDEPPVNDWSSNHGSEKGEVLEGTLEAGGPEADHQYQQQQQEYVALWLADLSVPEFNNETENNSTESQIELSEDLNAVTEMANQPLHGASLADETSTVKADEDVGLTENPLPDLSPAEPDESVADIWTSAKQRSDKSTMDIDPDMVSRYILDSTVSFGPGAAVSKVVTAFESYFVILSNLPRNVMGVGIANLTERFGQVLNVRLERHGHDLPPTAMVEFNECAEAALAVRTLDKSEYQSMLLSATLALGEGIQRETVADPSSFMVKISWSTPSTIAWVRYDSITTSKEQFKQLQGLTMGGRKIAVIYISPAKKQTYGFTIHLRNLPPNTTKEDLQAVCPGISSLDICDETIYTRDASIRAIRQLLAPHEPLKSFYALPPDASKLRILTFAENQNPTKLTKALHRSQPDVLRANFLSAEQVYVMRYDLAASQFLILKDDLHRLRDTHQSDCKIRLCDKDRDGQATDIATIHIDSKDPTVVGRVRKALDLMLRGEALLLDGKVLWDELFDTLDSDAFFDSLNADTRFFIQHSRRDRTLRYFSRQLPIQDVVDVVVHHLKLFRGRRHNITVDREVIRLLLKERIKKMREDDGISATLNVVTQTLSVQSKNQNDIKKVKRILAELKIASSGNAVVVGHGCSVCSSSIAEPIVMPCGHVYCGSCLRHILRNPAAANPPFMCMMDQPDNDFETNAPCYTEFPIHTICEVLSTEDQNRLFSLSLLSYVRQHPEEFHFCPTPECQIFYRRDIPGTALRCPSCQKRICPSCCVQFHEGLSCAEYQEA